MSPGAMTVTGTYRSISWPRPFSCINFSLSTLPGRTYYYYPHFIVEPTEALRGQMSHSRSRSW